MSFVHRRNFTTRQPRNWDHHRAIFNNRPQAIPASGTSKENPPTDNDAQVYVNNLPSSFTAPELLKLFEPFGCVTSHRIIMRDGQSRGFGFVSFKTEEEAKRVTIELNGKHQFPNGKQLHARVMQKNLERLFVKNLHADVTWKDLFRLFVKQGRVKYANVIMDERGVNRGYSSGMGTVCYQKPEDAAKAVAKLNGYKLHGQPLRVEYFKTNYELKKEKLDKYYKEERPRNPVNSLRNAVSRTVVSNPNDAAGELQTLANRLCEFVKVLNDKNFEKITLMLLEYENSELSMLLNNPNVLKREVENAASLITIAEMNLVNQ